MNLYLPPNSKNNDSRHPVSTKTNHLPRFTPRKQDHSQSSGIALVITLMILGMLLILLIAFTANVRVERQLSKSSTDEIRARMLAQAAIDQAIYQLTAATTNASYITFYKNPNWTTLNLQDPILQITNTTVPPALTVLDSGSPPPPPPPESPDLNATNTIVLRNHLLQPFQRNWIYLVNNGVTNGRFAFWCDDESMKMNLLVGGTNNAMYGKSELEMNISSLPSLSLLFAGNLLNGRAQGFETIETLREYIGGGFTEDNYHVAKFYSTIYSHDVDTNYLASIKLDINSLATSNILQITNAIEKTYPPLAQKYDANDRLQFAANLKEWLNPSPLHQPANENILITTPYGTIPLLGRNQTPLINEITVQTFMTRTANGVNNDFAITNRIQVELINLYSKLYTYPAGARIEILGIPSLVINNQINNSLNLVPVSPGWPTIIDLSGLTIAPYSLVTYSNIVAPSIPSIATNGYEGVILNVPVTPTYAIFTYTNSGGLVDIAQVHIDQQTLGVLGNPALTGVTSSSITNMGTNLVLVIPGDPRVAKTTNLWVYANQTPNQTNLTYKPDLPPSATYFGDSNSPSQLQADGGFFFRNGPMESIAEIGRIPIQFNFTTNMWRTLKLYGDGNGTALNNEDYMLLDYITVTNLIRARVNLNEAKGDTTPGITNGVLASLFERASIPTNAIAINAGDFKILGSIPSTPPLQGILASNIVAKGQSILGPYQSIGHFLQLNSNLLSNISSPDQTTDARREGPLTSIANAITVHGEQFTIYGLGQSIQFVRDQTNILGEAYIQAVVERVPIPLYLSPSNIYYRTLYYRILSQ